MTPAPPASRPPATLGCLLVAAIALLLSGCGDDGGATAETTARGGSKAAAQTKAGAPAARCPARVGGFVRSLDDLRRQLAVGLSYEQYAARVRDLRRDYEEIPFEHLAIDCLATSGTPAENAFNKYIDATNEWGECLADAACSTASIEPVLQQSWRAASSFLSEAR
jgi:hypothetical protein